MDKKEAYYVLPRKEAKLNLAVQRGPQMSVQVREKTRVKMKVSRCIVNNSKPTIIDINQNPDDDRMVYLRINVLKGEQQTNGHMFNGGKPQVGRLQSFEKQQKAPKPEVEVGKLTNEHRKRAPIRQKEKPATQASDFEAIMNRRKKYVDTMDNTGRLLGEIRQQGDGKKKNLSQSWTQVRNCARVKSYLEYEKIKVVKMPELNLY